MIRFLESLMLSGHCRSAVTASSRSVRHAVLVSAHRGVVEATRLRDSSNSSISCSSTAAETPEFAGAVFQRFLLRTFPTAADTLAVLRIGSGL